MHRRHRPQSWIRKQRVLLVGIIMLSLLLSACGSAPPKVYRVGVLSGLDFLADLTDGFKEGMAELGYVEGQNISYDVQKTNFDMAAYKRILQKFVADKVDLILVFPTEASLEAKAATQGTNIPVVFSFSFVEDMGLVNSVREPGGNITGVRYPGTDVALKRFEILRTLAPQAKRVWMPYQRGYPSVPSQMAVLRPVAAAAGVTLIEAPADNAAELDAELKARTQAGHSDVDAILTLAEPLAVVPDAFAVIGKFAYEHKLPIGGTSITQGDYASVFGVNVFTRGSGKQAALLADRIFKGTPPGTIPVVSPETYLEINYKAAQALGVTVPEGLLKQAYQVVR
jgi:putative ABC transport system substrate-binding protein